ncbi:acyltransferase family protein [Thermoleptolyngbya sp. C42_A2020_037]|uniref:acyltransferase family protein n=1 Tax=Thermoleptolyngbya sp. C42_A2020_037 TaxID=2747799 RepID=UPI0019E273D1|nr:acyltransferase family protein [Thermoleptolyngbya sp. C42_A2020_037]MBF2083044.1 acyltransferase family protein [Thermoleptolyngbya sp. C42_A2020_037]
MNPPGISTLDRATVDASCTGAQSQRITLIDYAKGIGIFLVVLGHVLRGLTGTVLQENALTQALDQWIYAFHMPLFFFLSGYLAERSVSKPLGTVVSSKLRAIAYPYFLWSAIQETLRHLAGISDQPLSSLWRIVYSPILQFWFLYVLFAVSLVYLLLRKLKVPVAVCFAGFALLFASEFVDLSLGPWPVLYMIRLNAVYFALGAIASGVDWVGRLQKVQRSILLPSAFFGFSLIALAAIVNLTSLEAWLFPLAVLGIVASLSLAAYLEDLQRISFLQTWGLRSLEIFVAHTIFTAATRIVLQKGMNLNQPVIHIIVGTALGLGASLLLYRLSVQLRILCLFRLQPPSASSFSPKIS